MDYALLKNLCDLNGVSGYEKNVTSFISSFETSSFFDYIGNCYFRNYDKKQWKRLAQSRFGKTALISKKYQKPCYRANLRLICALQRVKMNLHWYLG
ncbi:MAG: hypothetical protein FWD49_02540 [Firmicutes bacterium]|nr:hypothetical protein [Bacillota bacterium]